MFIDFLQKVTPLKITYLGANYSEFMAKETSKVIMLRTNLRYQSLEKRHQ